MKPQTLSLISLMNGVKYGLLNMNMSHNGF
jgi:hypothetical protein